MRKSIRFGKESPNNKTIEFYSNLGVFDENQLRIIERGLKFNVDVSTYADPNISGVRMKEARIKLMKQ